ncbi:MAG: tetratricopeptide repeat protein [Bryobacteraceae bacterium]
MNLGQTALILIITTGAAAPALAADPCRAGAEAVQRRDLARAEQLLKRCLETQPAQVEPYLQLCGVYQMQNNPNALYRTANEGLTKFPQEKRFYLTVAAHDGRNERYERAIENLEKGFRRWPEDDKIKSLLASSHFARGTELLDAAQNEAAVEHLQRATDLAPSDVDAHLNLGRALHNLLRNTDALAVFNRVIELSPALPLARFHRGLSLYTLGEFERAIDDLNKEIATNPGYPPAHLIRGLALLGNAEWDKALADLDLAAARMPGNAKAQYARARVLVQLGRLEEAETDLRKAMKLDASDPAPLNTLVTVLLRLDRADEARTLAQKASKLARARRTADPGEIRFESFRRPRP